MTKQLLTNLSSGHPSVDDILRQIEQAVLDHRLPPGTKLKEVQLAEIFGVKRGAIRKVLARLASSRLVVQQPNCGARVAQPSAEEGRDLFAARRAIESATIETLIAKTSPTIITQLRNQIGLEQKAYEKGDTKLALDLSVDFHRQLAILAGNGVMLEFLNETIQRTPLVILAHLSADDENRCRNQEHEAIVNAIANGDSKLAKQMMNNHLLHIENQIDDKVERKQPDLASLLLPRQ